MFLKFFLFIIPIQVCSILLFFYLTNKYLVNINSKNVFKEVGGISIFLTLLISVFYFEYDYFINLLIITSSIILITGFLDDLFNLNAIVRTIIQIVSIIILILFGYKISNTGYFDLNNYHQIYGTIFTIFCVLLLINAINFLDGLDGIAGFNLIFSFIIIIFYSFLFSKDFNYIFLFVLILVISVFLIFNLNSKFFIHIFLGDAGSNSVGFILAWLLIYYTSAEINLFPPALAIWVIAYPMFDMLSIIIKRTANKKNPYTKDYNHNHHNLLRQSYSIIQINLIINFISLFLAVIGYISLINFGENFSIILYVICFLMYYYVFYYKSHFYK